MKTLISPIDLILFRVRACDNCFHCAQKEPRAKEVTSLIHALAGSLGILPLYCIMLQE